MYENTIEWLIEVANILDEDGQYKMADAVDNAIRIIIAKKGGPKKGVFPKGFRKHWKEHFSDKSKKHPHTEAVKSLKGKGIKDPHRLSAWLEHKTTGKWPAERVSEQKKKKGKK